MTESLDAALAAARSFFDALSTGSHRRASAMVAQADRIVFREKQLASLTSWAFQRDAINSMLSGAAEGAVSFASDGVYRPEELARVAETPLIHIANVHTLGEYAALSPDEFLSLYLDLSTPLSGNVGSDTMERPRYRVLGGVLDGSEVVHVVYRCEAGYDDPHHVNVLRVVRYADGWTVDISTAGHDIVNSSWLMLTIDHASFGGSADVDSPDV
jgi:hypothetical protein